MAVMEVEQQRTNAWAKRRSRTQADGGLGPIAMPALATASAEQLDPGHYRTDHGKVDVIIAMTAALRCLGHRRAAMGAVRGHAPLGLVGRIGQGYRCLWPPGRGGRNRRLQGDPE